MRRSVLFTFFMLVCALAFSQRGKDGSPTISTAKVVNEYTTLTKDAKIGDTLITVANSALNAKGRFGGNLAAGDLVFIIQMQGASINAYPFLPWHPRWGAPSDSTYGAITNYNNCGNNEFAEVKSVPNGTTIIFDCQLQHAYNDSGKVQIVRVPRYNSLTINSGGSIGCDAWDSAKGGVVAIEVLNNTIINSGGKIDVSGNGFRGGALDFNVSTFGVNNTAAMDSTFGKQKGEGIAGFTWRYNDYLGGMYGFGSPANGGGGGDAHNGGGGGGSNGGNPANWINGFGNPDISTANNKTAWNKEYSWMSVFTASGGGRGGYTFSSSNQSPQTLAPGNSTWGGDNRRPFGGLGGRPLDYTTGRLFIGGGGGAGDQDDGFGGAGGNGAGMVYLISYGTVSGAGQILANGANGTNAAGTPASTSYSGKDGAGGAGAGGTIIVNSVGNISGITIQTNGGAGGNQVLTPGTFYFKTIYEAEGPGGGGGGGYIATSNIGVTETATGGANGTTNSASMKNFPPNGATAGGAGTIGASITNFQIVAKNDTICSGNTATLNASLTGTVPGGTTIEWYTTQVGGNAVGTGASYTTPVLTVNTTYYVGTCPGTYRQAVNVIIGSSASTTISPGTAICSGNSTPLTATGGSSYSWAPAAGLSCTNCANPTASPTVTTMYTVTITTGCGTAKDSVLVTVNSVAGATISAAPSAVCSGTSSTLTANGGTTYSWNTGATTSSISVTPASTTTYTVHITKSGCTKDTTATVTVNPIPKATFTGATTICAGNSTALTVSGGTTYSWSPSTGLSCTTCTNPTASPTVTTIYSVQVTKAGCTLDTTITINVNAKPVVTVTPPSPGICSGGNVSLTAGGASTYTWATGTGLTCTNCANPTASPASTITYTVIGTSAAGCADTTTVTVTVGAKLTASISGKDTICSGNSTTLTASGGSTYAWSNGSTNASITVSPASTASYTVTVSNGGCPPAKDSVTVKVNPTPVPGITSSANPICAGSSATLNASGGATYSWNTGATTSSITVTPASTTSYTVAVSNGTCTKDTNITVTVNPVPVPTITPPATVCSGKTVSITAGGGTSYSWSPSTGLSSTTSATVGATPASTTTYTVSVSNGSCSKDTMVTITVNPSPTVAISGNNAICVGDSSVLTGSGAATYVWNTGATTTTITVKPATTTTYTIVGKNAGGCADSITYTVNVGTKPTPTVSGTQTICDGSSTTISASGGTSYTWSPSAGLSSTSSSTPTASPSVTTNYVVSVSNGGCSVKDSVLVIVKPAAAGSACCNATITSGQSTTLSITGGGAGNTYNWTPAAGLSCTACPNPEATPTTTTTYYVDITDTDGCTRRDSVIIIVKENCGQLFVPDAFSPNGDNQNDVLYVRGNCIKTIDFSIYDRWGNRIFETTDAANGWDGTFNNSPMNSGTYVYYLQVLLIDNSTITKKGNITLVR